MKFKLFDKQSSCKSFSKAIIKVFKIEIDYINCFKYNWTTYS